MIEPVAIALPTLQTDSDEVILVHSLLQQLAGFRMRNRLKHRYYEAKKTLAGYELGFASNRAQLARLATAVGWPGTIVDTLEERLDFQGWIDENDVLDLATIYQSNDLGNESSGGHLDALITGINFVAVGAGQTGEPNPLITVESPDVVTGTWDPRVRRLKNGIGVDEWENGQPREATLYLPNSNVRFRKTDAGWRQIERDNHNLGRVLLARLVNRGRSSAPGGRSEITPAIRGLTDEGVRTLLGMTVNREFFSSPQRYALGADPSDFVKGDQVQTGWELVLGSFLALRRDEDGELPEVGQFPQAVAGPYVEQMRALTQLVAAEGAIPPPYLGFSTENPSSADAIRMIESRLIKRAERRQASFGAGWREVAALSLLVRDGSIPEEFSRVSVKWRDAATPTRAADADATTKLIAAGILPPDSPVTWDRIGLTPQEQRRLESDLRRNRAASALDNLAKLAAAPAPTEEAPTEDVTDVGGA